MRKKYNRMIGLLAAISFATVSLTGCKVGNTQIKLESIRLSNNKSVFQINDYKCSLKLAKLYLCNYRNLYGSAYGMDLWQYDFGEESLEQYVKDVTIQELSRIACMDLLAEEQEMRLTDAESDLAKKAAKVYFASLSDAEKSYMDVHESDIQEAYASYALAEKLYRTMTEGIDEEVSDDEARVIRVQQIYVTDAGIAKEVQKKLKDGEDFAAVAGTYNEKSKIETTVARGDYPHDVENIAFNLDNDTCSEMIETEDGFYFIKCLNKLEEQLTEENKSNIRIKREKEQFEDAYQSFVDSAAFEMNDSLWKEITLEDTSDITTDSFFDVYDKYFTETDQT